MINLSLASTLEKHKIATTNPWYILLDIAVTPSVTIRVNRSPQDVIYKSNTYIAFNFELDEVSDNSKGQLPSIHVRISNVSLLLQQYLEQYNGGIGATVVVRVVNAANLAGEPELDMTFTVIDVSADAQWVDFTLGAGNPMLQKFPLYSYLNNHCLWKFNTPAMQAANDVTGMQCNYQGGLTSCDKTLDGVNGCRAHSNQARFGGYPAIDTQGFRSASVV